MLAKFSMHVYSGKALTPGSPLLTMRPETSRVMPLHICCFLSKALEPKVECGVLVLQPASGCGFGVPAVS